MINDHERKASMVTRYRRPSSEDKEPFGTQWRYVSENDTHETYIQLSDEDTPHWEKLKKITDMLFEILKEKI